MSSYLLLLVILIAANSFIYKTVFAPHVLTVNVLALGKGNATLVRAPDGKALLIDDGPDASILRALGEILPIWQRSIDAIILTSASTKQTGGTRYVTSRYYVTNTVNFGSPDSPPYGTQLMFAKNISIIVITPGIFTISYGATSLAISSSTSPGTFISDGKMILEN